MEIRQLTKQEINILKMIAAGKENPEIIKKIKIPAGTLEYRISRLFSLFGAKNRANMIAIAIRAKVID